MNYNEFKEMFDEELKKIIDNDFSEEIFKKFYKYMQLLKEWNEKINLTAIVEDKDIIIKHFIDSLTIYNYLKDEKSFIDVGTGAGFPGLPIKIIDDNIKGVLLDSLNKRINFLNEIINECEINNIDAIHGRAEEYAINNREKFDIATSRAVARLNILVEYLLPFVKVGGKCICMKGSSCEEEIEEAKYAIEILGGKIEEINNFYIPGTDIERTIVVIKKIKNTPVKYPRKAGIPTKMSLIRN